MTGGQEMSLPVLCDDDASLLDGRHGFCSFAFFLILLSSTLGLGNSSKSHLLMKRPKETLSPKLVTVCSFFKKVILLSQFGSSPDGPGTSIASIFDGAMSIGAMASCFWVKEMCSQWVRTAAV
jgi:hypothetical protein